MLRIAYEEVKRLKNFKLKRIGASVFVILILLFLLSFASVGELDEVIRQISDILIFRILCILGLLVSGLIIWRGEELYRGIAPFAEAKRLEAEIGECSKIFERIMEERWR